jgi:hypothetical protein
MYIEIAVVAPLVDWSRKTEIKQADAVTASRGPVMTGEDVAGGGPVFFGEGCGPAARSSATSIHGVPANRDAKRAPGAAAGVLPRTGGDAFSRAAASGNKPG